MEAIVIIIVFFFFCFLLIVKIGLWLIFTYNSLVPLRNEVRKEWSQIDVQLKRRHDLIRNLVETVRGYAAHERETLENVIRARALAATARDAAAAGRAEGDLSRAYHRLLAVVESYPELKADQNFLLLQRELAATEDRISLARQAYNEAVLRLNTRVESFPTILAASILGFSAERFFTLGGVDESSAPAFNFRS